MLGILGFTKCGNCTELHHTKQQYGYMRHMCSAPPPDHIGAATRFSPTYWCTTWARHPVNTRFVRHLTAWRSAIASLPAFLAVCLAAARQANQLLR